VIERYLEWRTARIGQKVLVAFPVPTLIELVWFLSFEIHFLAAMTAEPAALVSRLIYGDAVDPGLNRAIAAKSRDVPENLQENFLHHIGGVGRIVQQAADDVIDRLLKALNQRFIGSLFAAAEAIEQNGVFLPRAECG
jgi:hypothetical protein